MASAYVNDTKKETFGMIKQEMSKIPETDNDACKNQPKTDMSLGTTTGTVTSLIQAATEPKAVVVEGATAAG